MNQGRADFVVMGSTPLARLVAGLLASTHGKRVVFAGESEARYRLPHGVELSVGPITRPETWSLLQSTVPETIKLVSRIGGAKSFSRVDSVQFAERDAGKQALAHIGQMALAFGHAAERLDPAAIGAGREGLVIRRGILLHRKVLEPSLDRWLEQHGVRRIAAGESLSIRDDGSAELTGGTEPIEIGQAVLADDAVIARYPGVATTPLLRCQTGSTILTEPTRAIASPVTLQLDDGITLLQPPGRGTTAIGPGSTDELAARLGHILGQGFIHAGQSSTETVVATDHAPAVGRLHGVGPDILAALGPTGAFLAPAIARWLCGMATAAENDWLGARLVNRTASPSLVAEPSPWS
jgi:hypothetical protein